MKTSTRLVTDALNADTMFVPTTGRFQATVDLLLTSGSSQTTSDHAVLNVEEHFASASIITIVVNFILHALFYFLEDLRKRSHATILPTMNCTLINIYIMLSISFP